MLLVLGLVLPVAGTPLRYCLCANEIVPTDAECCDCGNETSCDCDGHCPHGPEQPPCLVELELVPDALPGVDFAMPLPVVMDLPPAAFVPPAPLASCNSCTVHPRDRGPPADPPCYLWHLALLL